MSDTPNEHVSNSKTDVHPLVNLLVQLQELTLVRAEQEELAGTGNNLVQLDKSIKALLHNLPPDIASLFQKLQKKDPVAIVPISNQVCCGCGMSLPISLAYSVKACEKLHQCTNCARLLYFPEVKPKGIGRKTKRTDPRKTGISRFSSLTLMEPNTKATEKEDVIRDMAMLMEINGFVDNGKALFSEALKREAIINTAVDNGLAFPHVRGVEGGGLTLSLATSQKGIKFDSSSRNKTHIVFFMVIPTAASVFYLRLLSGLTQSFMDKDNRDRLLAANTKEELWAALVKATKVKIK